MWTNFGYWGFSVEIRDPCTPRFVRWLIACRVFRIYRRMSSTVALHVPPDVLMVLKVWEKVYFSTVIYYTNSDCRQGHYWNFFYCFSLTTEVTSQRPLACVKQISSDHSVLLLGRHYMLTTTELGVKTWLIESAYTRNRRPWEVCLRGALQIYKLVDWFSWGAWHPVTLTCDRFNWKLAHREFLPLGRFLFFYIFLCSS